MTIGELQLVVDSYKVRKDNEAKEKVALNYNLATFISSFVVRQMNGDQIPPLTELYPDMFESEVQEDLEKQRTEYLKAQLMEFTIGHNSRTNKGGNK